MHRPLPLADTFISYMIPSIPSIPLHKLVPSVLETLSYAAQKTAAEHQRLEFAVLNATQVAKKSHVNFLRATDAVLQITDASEFGMDLIDIAHSAACRASWAAVEVDIRKEELAAFDEKRVFLQHMFD